MHSTAEDLRSAFYRKHGQPADIGPHPKLRLRHDYFTPEDHYELLISQLVQPATTWLDVGCGRNILPENPVLARILSERCACVVGIDPDETILKNPFVHEQVQCAVEKFETTRKFQLVTLRMTAEHIEAPTAAVRSIARLTRPGSKVVIYTVNCWSPVALIARVVPFEFHHAVKRLFWGTEQEDTFPVAYRMNTRKRLACVLGDEGFKELSFTYLSDCRIFMRFGFLHRLELMAFRVCRALNLRYPENCLLGVYEKT